MAKAHNISNIRGTYSKVIGDNIKDINSRYETDSFAEYKGYILGLVETASDTAARANFIASINKQSSKDGILMLVTNAWLRGQGMGADINDKFAR